MKLNISITIIVLFLSFPQPLFCLTVNISYLEKADMMNLSQDKEWLSLLFYKNNESIIKNKDFFAHKDGNINPKQEMIAIITSFYESDGICRYPARFDFLNKKLNFNNLPYIECKELNEFINEINPISLTLLFPSGYVNNPASMFGHTLMRINKKNAKENNTNINSYILNYGAETKGEINGLIYAFNGLFGFYEGFYSVMPYYKIINKYSNLENRDIWEYELKYTEEQAIYYTKHIYELLKARIDYYFLKENCSYLILQTLNILQPEIDLTDNFILTTTPIETIKTLYKNDLVLNINFRASLKTDILNNIKNLTKQEIKNISNNNYFKNENSNSLYYETIYKYLEYRKIENKISDSEYRKNVLKVLKKINNIESYNHLHHETPIPPEYSHNIKKINIGIGNDYFYLNYKPAYNELIDNTIGINSQSEINFLNFELRLNKKNEIDLYEFDILKIKSIPQVNSLYFSPSFNIEIGINDRYHHNKIFNFNTNIGYTFGNSIISFFTLGGIKADYSGFFDNNYSFGFNAFSGIVLNYNIGKILIKYEINKLIQNKYNYDILNIENNFFINTNLYINSKYDSFYYKNYKNKKQYSIGVGYFF
jgi:hypothetical protein